MTAKISRLLGRQRSLLVVALAALLSVASLGITAQSAFATDTTLCSSSYPNDRSACTSIGYTDHGYSDHTGTSYWSAYTGTDGHNCTNYVAFMESTINGASAPNYLLGNGSEWDNNASAHGIPVNTSPGLGSVAQWEASTAQSHYHPSGHVAYVEWIARNADGSVQSITVSEDNWSTGPYAWETISPGEANYPQHFIHFKDRPHYQPFAADFNGDGQMDIGLKDDTNGVFYMKYGPDFTTQIASGWAPGSNYRALAGDFNGDGLADISLQDPNNGLFYFKFGPGFTTQTAYGWAKGWHYQPFVGDFNGDHVTDIGLRDPTNGIMYMRMGPDYSKQTAYGWATGFHYQPFAGDFNGDGLADLGLRDPSNGITYMRMGPDYKTQTAYGWAMGFHYQPFAADFNRDGLTDLGLRDPNNGVFYIRFGPTYVDQIATGWAAG